MGKFSVRGQWDTRMNSAKEVETVGLEFSRGVWEQKAWETTGQRRGLNKQRVGVEGQCGTREMVSGRRLRSAGHMLLRE